MTLQELLSLITVMTALVGPALAIIVTGRNERKRLEDAFKRERQVAQEAAKAAAEQEQAAAGRAAAREAAAVAKAVRESRELLLGKVLALGSSFLRSSSDDRPRTLVELADLAGQALLLPDEHFRASFSTFVDRCHRVVYKDGDTQAMNDAGALLDQLANDARVLLGQPSDRIRVLVRTSGSLAKPP